jgi:hypothetical protein
MKKVGYDIMKKRNKKFPNSGLPHPNFYFFSYENFHYTLKVFSKINVS